MLLLDPANTKSYPGSGTDWTDLSRTQSGEYLLGGITFSSDGAGSLDVDGALVTSNQRIGVTQFTFAESSERTLDFWVKVSTGARTGFHSLGGLGSTTRWLFLYNSDTSNNNWYVGWREYGALYNNFSARTEDNDSWINIVLTFDSSKNIKFYLNSDFKQQLTAGFTVQPIGRLASGYSNISGNYHPFDGKFGITRFYNRILSDVEILQNYNALKGRYQV